MQYRQLGRSDLRVSILGLGTEQMGWTATEQDARAVLDAFVEAGGNFIETGDFYSNWAHGNPGGVAEEIIGRWMKDRGIRDRVVLATQVGVRMWPGLDGSGLGRAHVTQAVEHSLRRLQTDHIDLYQASSCDPEVPIEETLEAFHDLIERGKVRYVGACNYPFWRFAEALSVGRSAGRASYVSLQVGYDLVRRDEYERQLRPICQSAAVAVIPYAPLARGFLTGKYSLGEPLPATARAPIVKQLYWDNPTAWAVLSAARQVAQNAGKSVAQVALAWALAQAGVTAPIVGANSVEQLVENLGAVEWRLSPAELQQLDVASPSTSEPSNLAR